MNQILMAENLKTKRTFVRKLGIGAPVLLAALSITLAADYFQIDVYNWWYVGIYPGIFALICGIIQNKDGRGKETGILFLPVSMQKIWMCKITAAAIWIGLANAVLCAISLAGGVVMRQLGLEGHVLPAGQQLLAACIIWITSIWQIPLCMWLSSKIKQLPMLICHVGLCILSSVTIALESGWIFVPYSYTARLIIPVLKILPNGLIAEPGAMTFHEALLSHAVIAPGLIISAALFLVLTKLTAVWYERKFTGDIAGGMSRMKEVKQ